MSLFIYGNGEGIDRVKDEINNPQETFKTIKEACIAVVKRYNNMFNLEDLYIRYYGYDKRINKDVYLIITSRYGEENYIKKYGCPQFVSYMVSI